jgi:DnaK suppressor protein
MGARQRGEQRVDIESIKRYLLDRKQEIEAELSALYQEKFSDGHVQDLGDQSLTSTMEDLRSSLHDTRRVEYKRILKALEMIDDGIYGDCVDCEMPIAEKRLRSFPNATRCVSCQEILEEQGSHL